MELINDAITQLGETRKSSRAIRHNANGSISKRNNTKEEWLKAVEMQINDGGSNRNRREADFNDKKLKDMVNDFKKVRDSLYEEYDWKKFNLSEVWKKWDNTIEVRRLPSDKPLNTTIPCAQTVCNCHTEIGATAAIFGAFFLLAICIMKLMKKLSTSI